MLATDPTRPPAGDFSSGGDAVDTAALAALLRLKSDELAAVAQRFEDLAGSPSALAPTPHAPTPHASTLTDVRPARAHDDAVQSLGCG
jgi:hypothetical protein